MSNRRLDFLIAVLLIVGAVYFSRNAHWIYLLLGLSLGRWFYRGEKSRSQRLFSAPWSPHDSRRKILVRRLMFGLAVASWACAVLVVPVWPKSFCLGMAVVFWLASGRRYPAHAPAPMDV